MDEPCPFCDPDPDQVFLETDLVIGLWDKYPISPGHALLVPRRNIAGWFGHPSKSNFLTDRDRAEIAKTWCYLTASVNTLSAFGA